MNRLIVSKGIAGLSLILLASVGCNDPEIQTYRVAKEERPHVAAAHDAHGRAPTLPHLHWDLPAGWVEQQPDRMRVASFLIRNDEGKMAQVAVIPLPGASNIEVESLNLWREELGLKPVKENDISTKGQPVQMGDTSATLYELVNSDAAVDGKIKNRILGVMAQREGVFWFVKMAGEDSLVAQQKPAFVRFLKSIQFHSGSHGPAQTGPAAVSANTEKVPADAALPNWEVPRGWREKAPGPMLSAAFTVSGEEDAAGDVTVSKLSGTGGGLVANVNRWRGQLGLEPASEADITSKVEWLEIDGRKAYLLDLTGTNVRSGKPSRMLAIGVPRDNETWFYKFMGADQLVGKEKGAFIDFVKSAY